MHVLVQVYQYIVEFVSQPYDFQGAYRIRRAKKELRRLKMNKAKQALTSDVCGGCQNSRELVLFLVRINMSKHE